MDAVGHVLSFSLYEGLVFGLIAIGMYLSFIMLNFPDLGVEGGFPMGAALAATLIVSGVNPFLATLAAFGIGLVIGLFTASLNTYLRIPAILCGVITIAVCWSLNLKIMDGANVSLLREVTVFDKVAELLGLTPGSIVVSIIVAAVIAVIVFLILNWFMRTELGLALRATGDNEKMVRALGSDVEKNILLGLCIGNGLCAMAGAVVAQGQGFGDVGLGIGVLLMGLASVIIGNALLQPRGVATMLLSALLGAFLYRLFISVALRLGMDPGDLKLITGVLVVIALAYPYIQKKIRHEWVPPASRLFG